jgi:hypothetical protein
MSKSIIDTSQIHKAGALIGLAGGAAEVAVVCAYARMTGADAGAVAGGVAASFGLQPEIATGIAIHMLLAAGLGAGLYTLLRALPDRARSYGAAPFMLASLAVVWAINFFVVLPVVNPSFIHLLPYGVTLASKLAFGAVAAGMLGFGQRAAVPAGEVLSVTGGLTR